MRPEAPSTCARLTMRASSANACKQETKPARHASGHWQWHRPRHKDTRHSSNIHWQRHLHRNELHTIIALLSLALLIGQDLLSHSHNTCSAFTFEQSLPSNTSTGSTTSTSTSITNTTITSTTSNTNTSTSNASLIAQVISTNNDANKSSGAISDEQQPNQVSKHNASSPLNITMPTASEFGPAFASCAPLAGQIVCNARAKCLMFVTSSNETASSSEASSQIEAQTSKFTRSMYDWREHDSNEPTEQDDYEDLYDQALVEAVDASVAATEPEPVPELEGQEEHEQQAELHVQVNNSVQLPPPPSDHVHGNQANKHHMQVHYHHPITRPLPQVHHRARLKQLAVGAAPDHLERSTQSSASQLPDDSDSNSASNSDSDSASSRSLIDGHNRRRDGGSNDDTISLMGQVSFSDIADSRAAAARSHLQSDQELESARFQVPEASSIRRINELSKLNASGALLEVTSQLNASALETGNFQANSTSKILELVANVHEHCFESIDLSSNELEFELWLELYALLMPHTRHSLIELNLSRNKLSKLGVTFTGFLELHLSTAKFDWPFGSGQHSMLLNQTTQQQQQQQQPKSYSLANAGKLFTSIKKCLYNKNSNKKQEEEEADATGYREATNKNQTTNKLPTNKSRQIQLELRALDLSHNQLKWLMNDQFRALGQVQSIRLDHNKIRFIHQHAFASLESLRFLSLANNRLQVIYIEQFQTNYNLISLNFRSNAVGYLRAGSFASLAKLKRLDLSENKLTILSNNAFIGLDGLDYLNLSANQFVHGCSSALHPMLKLRKLDLSQNLMTQLQPGTFFHLNVEQIWLQQSEQLVSIERGAFWDLPRLKRLTLSSSSVLMNVNPQAFVGVPNLTKVDSTNCVSLDSQSRQVLDNVTLTNRYRHLRQRQHQHQHHLVKSSSKLNSSSSSKQLTHLNRIQESHQRQQMVARLAALPLVPGAHKPRAAKSAAQANQDDISHILEVANNRLKYAYYATSLAFLIVALKLVLKYTSTGSSRVERMRNRRRVYESRHSSSGQDQEQGQSNELAMSECAEFEDEHEHETSSCNNSMMLMKLQHASTNEHANIDTAQDGSSHLAEEEQSETQVKLKMQDIEERQSDCVSNEPAYVTSGSGESESESECDNDVHVDAYPDPDPGEDANVGSECEQSYENEPANLSLMSQPADCDMTDDHLALPPELDQLNASDLHHVMPSSQLLSDCLYDMTFGICQTNDQLPLSVTLNQDQKSSMDCEHEAVLEQLIQSELLGTRGFQVQPFNHSNCNHFYATQTQQVSQMKPSHEAACSSCMSSDSGSCHYVAH